MMIRPEYKQGARGKWRWNLKDENDKFRGSAPPSGFDTQKEAVADWNDIYEGATRIAREMLHSAQSLIQLQQETIANIKRNRRNDLILVSAATFIAGVLMSDMVWSLFG